MKSKTKIIPADISFADAKREVEKQYGGLKIPRKDLHSKCNLTWFDVIIKIQIAVNRDRDLHRTENISEAYINILKREGDKITMQCENNELVIHTGDFAARGARSGKSGEYGKKVKVKFN